MTLDKESLPANEFEEVRRIALEVANRRKEREKSESSGGQGRDSQAKKLIEKLIEMEF